MFSQIPVPAGIIRLPKALPRVWVAETTLPQRSATTKWVVWTADGGTNDGVGLTTSITVKPVNDPPKFVLGPTVTVPEDAPAQVVPAFVSDLSPGPPDEADQTSVDFNLLDVVAHGSSFDGRRGSPARTPR